MNANILKYAIEELDIPVRSYNGLRSLGIRTIRDLIDITELDILKRSTVIGNKSIGEIKAALDKFSLRLGMSVSEVKDYKNKNREESVITLLDHYICAAIQGFCASADLLLSDEEIVDRAINIAKLAILRKRAKT